MSWCWLLWPGPRPDKATCLALDPVLPQSDFSKVVALGRASCDAEQLPLPAARAINAPGILESESSAIKLNTANEPAFTGIMRVAIMSGLCLYFAFVYFHLAAPSALLPHLMVDFDILAGEAGALCACFLYAYGALQIPFGVLMDRHDSYIVVGLGALATVVGTMIFATASSVFAAVVGRFVVGVGSTPAWIASVQISADIFPANKALSCGFVVACGMGGAALAQGPFAIGIQHLGWRPIMGGSAIVPVLCAIPLLLAARIRCERHAAATMSNGQRNRKGLRQVSLSIIGAWWNWLLICFGVSISGARLAFMAGWAMPMVQVYQPQLAASSAGAVVTCGYICMAISSPLSGWYADKTGRHTFVLLVTCGTSPIWICVLVLLGDRLPVFLLAGVFAILGCSLGPMPLLFTITKMWNSPDVGASANGFVNTFTVLCGIASLPLSGVILDSAWDGSTDASGKPLYSASSFRKAMSIFIGMTILATLATLIMNLRKESIHNAKSGSDNSSRSRTTSGSWQNAAAASE